MDQPRVLIVDDEPSMLKLAGRLMEASGYDVMVALDGEQALEAMGQVTPDLILCDINMPGMNGYSFYKAVRSRHEWVTIPFIFLTGRGDRADVLAGKALGVEDYLTKPFHLPELQVAVRARLERAQAIREAFRTEGKRLAESRCVS